MSNTHERCVLLFSGGRDSTLAALRLAETTEHLVLATVTSDHLIGLSTVEARVQELKTKWSKRSVEWVVVPQPREIVPLGGFYAPTCLPCHHAYVSIGVKLARLIGTPTVAFGYVQYQSSWPEQTPEATRRLQAILAQHNQRLLLPVYDVTSREQVLRLLEQAGVSTASLEQKCNRQVTNIELAPDLLAKELDLWEGSINATLAKLEDVPLSIERQVIVSTSA
jgi:PP-loop superfamily ATP-utilizing enzyme